MNRTSSFQKFAKFFDFLKSQTQGKDIDVKQAGKEFGKNMSSKKKSKKTQLERLHFGNFRPMKKFKWEKQ